MTSWAAITPEGGPKEVEQARQRLDELRGRTGTERDRVEQVKRDLAAAEAADRDKMAAAFAAGNEPTSDVRAIEKLRANVGEAERRAVALDAAIAQADAQLGEQVEKHRTRWQADSEQAVEKDREQARRLLAQLAEAIAEMGRHAAVAAWLAPEGAADAGRPAKYPSGHARSSAHAMANGQPADAELLLRWVAELIEPAVVPAVVAEPVLDVVA